MCDFVGVSSVSDSSDASSVSGFRGVWSSSGVTGASDDSSVCGASVVLVVWLMLPLVFCTTGSVCGACGVRGV